MTDDLRLAQPADKAAVEAIVRQAYSHYVARIGREPGPMLDDYGDLISRKLVRVIDRGGVVKGILVLIPEAEQMLLDNIAVAPDAQGTGIGARLLAYAEQAAREAGYGSIRLYTHVMMVENIALYSRIGYVETHRGRENGLDRVYMAKKIAAAG